MLNSRFAQALSLFLLLSFMVILPAGVYADARQWGEDGKPLRQGHHIEWQRASYRNDDGYTLVAWSDTRTGDRDVYGQLISPDGTQLWDSAGTVLARTREFRQEDPEVVWVGDGWIVAWFDFREDFEGGDAWVQKFDMNGNAQWPANNGTGVRLDADTAVVQEVTLRAVHDGNGGAIIAWVDDRRDSQGDIVAQHVDASGNVTCPQTLAVTNADNGQVNLTADSDGNGNMLVAWEDGRTDNAAPDIYAAKVTPSCTLPWGNIVVCNASGEQSAPKLCPDGNGGCYIAWVDKRDGVEDIYGQRLDGNGQAQWTANGMPICNAVGIQTSVRVASSMNGSNQDGVVLVWEDKRVNNVISEIYSQKLNGQGAEQWQAGGFKICGDATPDFGGYDRIQARLASDNAGGLVCAWEDTRNGDHLTDNADIYFGRVLANGTNACGECGVEVAVADKHQMGPLVRLDGGNGAYVFWSDWRTGSQSLRYRNFDLGNCTPTPDEQIVYGLDGNATTPGTVAMGGGRTGVVWVDNRLGTGGKALYYQIIDTTGQMMRQVNGDPIAPNNTDGSLFIQDSLKLCTDGDNGFFVSWVDNRSGTKLIRLSHVNSAGEVVYGDSGLVVFNAVRDQVSAALAPDGQGGVYIAWSGYAPNFWMDIYVARVSADLHRIWGPVRLSETEWDDVISGVVTNPDGGCTVAWLSGPFENVNVTAARLNSDSTIVWNHDICDDPTNQDKAAIAADGSGGTYIAWSDSRNEAALLDIYAQHVSDAGADMWQHNGILVISADENQNVPGVAVDSDGNMFMVWQDFRNGVDTDLYGQKITPNGTLLWPADGKPICVAPGEQVEQAMRVEWADGLYVLWNDGRGYYSDIYGTHLTPAGQPADSYWWPDSGNVIMDFFHIQDLPTATDDFHGGVMSAWQDYRASGKEPLINVWAQWVNDYSVSVHEIPNVAVPKLHELAQNYPNPFNPTTQIRFSIPIAEQVEIVVFNTLGQRVATLVNKVMNAGSYMVEFEANTLPSGTYFYRLHTPAFQTVRKMVLLR
jgi:hypothetical protein